MPLPPPDALAPGAGGAAVHDPSGNQLPADVGPRSVWPVQRGGSDPLAFLAALSETDDPVTPFTVGRRPAFLLNDPAIVEEVLVRRPAAFPKGRGYQHAARLLGAGLLTVSSERHRERRRVLQSAFHRHRVAALAPTIVRHARSRASAWKAGEPVDVAREMRALTLGIAGDTLFGADLSPWFDEVHEAVSLALSPLDGLLAIVAPPARARRARRRLETVVEAIVSARAHRGARGADEEDLLAILLAARDEASVTDGDAGASGRADAQLHDDVLTFLLASHDTLSHALTWTWLLLAAHRDADEHLARELAGVLQGRDARAEDVPRLVYTRAVVAEALRLFPPAWVIVRRASEACTLGSADVPAGAVVVASPFTMQRRAAFFHQPLQFLPERWLEEHEAGQGPLPAGPPRPDDRPRPRLAYFPFGAGPRACIGEGFAWFEATLVLATLARSWRLERTSTAPVGASARITLRPLDEPPMLPVPRT